MYKPRKGSRIYNGLKEKTLSIALRQELALRFDLSEESWLSEMVVNRFLETLEQWEKENAILRIYPGEILICYCQKLVKLPLLTVHTAQLLGENKSFPAHKRRILVHCLDILQNINPEAADLDLAKFISRRDLISRYSPYVKLKVVPLPAGASLVSPKQVGATCSQITSNQIPIPKELEQQLIEFITKELGQGALMAKSITQFLLAKREIYCPLSCNLNPGQMLWLASSIKKYKRIGLQISRRLLKPVVLTIYTQKELDTKISTWQEMNSLQMNQIARITVEAYLQDTLLPQVELQLIFLRGYTVIKNLIRNYMHKYKVILPTPGTILDSGTMFTHKEIVIELALKGLYTTEIAKKIYHTPEAVDAYLKLFNSILILYHYGVPLDFMSRVTGRGQKVIKEHLEVIKKYFPDKQTLINYLKLQGVRL